MDLHLAPQDLPLAAPALQTVYIGGADDLADVFPRQHPYAVDVTDRAGAVRTVELNAQIRRQVVAFPPGGPEYVVNGPMDAIVTLEGAEWGADIPVTVRPPDGQKTPVVALVKSMAVIGYQVPDGAATLELIDPGL